MILVFIKFIRGSDFDVVVYWFVRFLDGGEDFKYMVRRLFIEVSEDIGMVNLEVFLVVNVVMNVCEKIGMLEVRIILVYIIIYFVIFFKLNLVYEVIDGVLVDIKKGEL